jgi:tetratricopeptide (TPR) repeat protein
MIEFMYSFKKYINIISMLFLGVMTACCSKFLDETPNKSGSAYIYHMDQLYEMTGSPDLYLFSNPGYMSYGMTGNFWAEQVYMTDAVEISPEFFYIGQQGNNSKYLNYCMDIPTWTEDQSGMSNTWTPSWERIYRFNTVLENLDKVTQTTKAVHDQVAGESYFGRAYYHFMLLVQYSLWAETEPGIGYREGTFPGEIPPRETVGYTIKKIYEDLDLAEKNLTSAGRTTFVKSTNFRPSLPAVKAFRARVDLYRGDYESALKNANDALSAYNKLVDFKNDPNYALSSFQNINLLNNTNSAVASVLNGKAPNIRNMGTQAVSTYDELYLTSMTTGNYLPMSESYYYLFDRTNDARWIYFYNSYYPLMNVSGLVQTKVIGGVPTSGCITWENQQWLKNANRHSYFRFYGNGCINILGMTTAEMYLIKAECLSRAGKTAEAAEVLKVLRRTRFMNDASANNIGGSVPEVLDERYREMTGLWRFFDIKRLNGAENAGISIRRQILSDQKNPNSVIELVIGPNDGRWALPLYKVEAANMGWEQNRGWE